MITNPLARRMAGVVLGLTLLVASGTVGYSLVERWPVADSFFMTVITLSTVGYGETHELSQSGRTFTSALIFCCMVGMTVWTASLTSLILEGDISGRFERSRVLRMIAKLKDHVVICGSDAMAHAVIERAVRNKKPLVIVDERTEGLERIQRRFRTPLLVDGKATNELKLAEANVLEAEVVVAAMENDVDNLLVGIACKDLDPRIRVIARSSDIGIANSMRKAGVDEVISPQQLCGQRVAELICEAPQANAAPRKTPSRDCLAPVASH